MRALISFFFSTAVFFYSLLDDDLRNRQQSLDEADEKIQLLEQQIETMKNTASNDPASVASISTAATIDNANLREQLSHAQNRIASLEDQLADNNLAVSRLGRNRLTFQT